MRKPRAVATRVRPRLASAAAALGRCQGGAAHADGAITAHLVRAPRPTIAPYLVLVPLAGLARTTDMPDEARRFCANSVPGGGLSSK